jgi:hypothetical protein
VIAVAAAVVLPLIAAPLRADDYATIASAVASPLPENRDELKKAYSDGQIMLRVELARQCLQTATSVASDLAPSRRNILQHLDSCRSSMQEIRRLDNNMPDIEAIAKKALKASPALVRTDAETGKLTPQDSQAVDELAATLIRESIKAIADAWKGSKERDNYRELYRLARGESLELANVAQRRCKGRSPVACGVGIAVDITDEAIVVHEAFANGPAGNAGLRKGDELLAVNGDMIKKSIGNRTVVDEKVFLGLRGERDTTVKLTYSRGGVTKIVELRRSYASKQTLLDIDFDGSWNAIFAQDALDLRNVSGEKLTNCTLLVTLQGTHGDSEKRVQRQHLHFVDQWPADEWRYAWYRSSTADGIAADESLDRVQRVVIELYSDQYRDTITHEYAGTPAFDEDIDRYVGLINKHQKFTLGYIADNILTDAGVSLQHDGTFTFIPDAKMTVTLKRGKDARTVVFRRFGKPWSAGFLSAYALKDSSFNGMNPDRVEIEMEFPDSSKKTSLSWNLNNR